MGGRVVGIRFPQILLDLHDVTIAIAMAILHRLQSIAILFQVPNNQFLVSLPNKNNLDMNFELDPDRIDTLLRILHYSFLLDGRLETNRPASSMCHLQECSK